MRIKRKMNKHIRKVVINSFNKEHFSHGYKPIIEELVDKGMCKTTRGHINIFGELDKDICPYLSTMSLNWNLTSDIICLYFNLDDYINSYQFNKFLYYIELN